MGLKYKGGKLFLRTGLNSPLALHIFFWHNVPPIISRSSGSWFSILDILIQTFSHMQNRLAITITAKGGIRDTDANVFDTLVTSNADLHLLYP